MCSSSLPRMDQHPRLSSERRGVRLGIETARLFDLLTAEGGARSAHGSREACKGSVYPKGRRPPYLHSVLEA